MINKILNQRTRATVSSLETSRERHDKSVDDKMHMSSKYSTLAKTCN